MADYSKFLVSKKTFSIFMEVKDFFKFDDVQFVNLKLGVENYLILFLKLKLTVQFLIAQKILDHDI